MSEMSRWLLAVALIGSVALASTAWAQAEKKTKKGPDVAPQELRFKKKAFSGNEFRLAAMNNVNADCSSGPIPDVRVLAKPANGDLRMEEIRAVIDRAPEDRRAYCNGKDVDARGLFYKSSDGFVGEDQVLLEVDFKTGTVRRYRFAIEVR